MRIIVFSDSHGMKRALDSIFAKTADTGDVFIHLGDGERELDMIRTEYPHLDIRHVSGNCDHDSMSPTFSVIEADGIKVFCTHGHRYGVNGGTELLRSIARDNGCKIALFGHTHCRYLSCEDGIYVMNPGSCSSPRDGKKPSFGLIDIVRNPDGKPAIVTNIADV